MPKTITKRGSAAESVSTTRTSTLPVRIQALAAELRAHDCDAGLVIEWIPDMTLPWNCDAVRAIDEGQSACSVGMVIRESRLTKLPHTVNMITRARLTHLAILSGDHLPAYAGARAKVFRSSWRDDPDELQKQIASTVERARWFSRRAQGY